MCLYADVVPRRVGLGFSSASEVIYMCVGIYACIYMEYAHTHTHTHTCSGPE